MDAARWSVAVASGGGSGGAAGVWRIPPGSLPAGVKSSDIDNAYAGAENDLVTLAPTTPHIFATGSEHYIQLSQPDLVINATLLVLARVATHGE